jgi:hypothetical protein
MAGAAPCKLQSPIAPSLGPTSTNRKYTYKVVPELGGYSVDNQRQVVELLDFFLARVPQPPAPLANKMATAAKRLGLQADRRPLKRPRQDAPAGVEGVYGGRAVASGAGGYGGGTGYEDDVQYVDQHGVWPGPGWMVHGLWCSAAGHCMPGW